MTKASFKTNILKKWYIYVACVIISALVWTWIIPATNKVPEEKEIHVLLCCDYCHDEDLKESLEGLAPDYIENVSLHVTYNSDGDYYYNLAYQLYGQLGGDIVILPITKIEVDNLSAYLPLDKSLIEEYYGESFEYIGSDEGVSYGIKINYQNNDLVTYNNDSENAVPYYLFFKDISNHLGILKDTDNDAALRLAELFLK